MYPINENQNQNTLLIEEETAYVIIAQRQEKYKIQNKSTTLHRNNMKCIMPY